MHLHCRYIDELPYLKLINSFSDPLEALDYLMLEKPDLVFLDVCMPGISGVELAQSIPAKVGIIFTTGLSKNSIPARVRSLACLSKPFNLQKFSDTMETIIELKSKEVVSLNCNIR